jgi:hypothetical protein
MILSGCTDGDGVDSAGSSYLYVGGRDTLSGLSFGDLLRVTGDEVRIETLSGMGDRVVTGGLEGLLNTPVVRLLDSLDEQVDNARLTSFPYSYQLGGETYWASFETDFTGFPEYARPGSRDFINRPLNWDSWVSGLAYTEYVLLDDTPQPVLIIGERQRSAYLTSWGVIVDTVGEDGFGGETIGTPDSEGERLNERIYFRRLSSPLSGFTPASFSRRLNEGFSRSFLLFESRPVPDAELSRGSQRLPRRATIDQDDLGEISASFIDGTRFLLLSDDHLILEGDYELDLDKGLLSVATDEGLVYRIFMRQDGDIIGLTLPVSVLRLEGGSLAGTDNYLRIEVVE